MATLTIRFSTGPFLGILGIWGASSTAFLVQAVPTVWWTGTIGAGAAAAGIGIGPQLAKLAYLKYRTTVYNISSPLLGSVVVGLILDQLDEMLPVFRVDLSAVLLEGGPHIVGERWVESSEQALGGWLAKLECVSAACARVVLVDGAACLDERDTHPTMLPRH